MSLRSISLIVISLIATAASAPANATTCGSVPYAFTANTTASASEVNANFNGIFNCANISLAPLANPAFTGTASFAGSIGVGTTSALNTLQIGPTGNTTTHYQLLFGAFDSTANLPQIIFNNNGTNFNAIGYDKTAGALVFGSTTSATAGTFSSENMVITQGGNVGIGTVSPAARLHVAKDDAIGVPSSGLGAANFTQFIVSGTSNPNQRIMVGYDTTNNYGIIAAANLSSNWVDLQLQPNSTSGVPNLTIKASGNVGIGTTSPATALQVVGFISQSGCTTAGTLSVNSSGEIICTSDARLKNLLGDYVGGLQVLSQIKPQLFTYRTTPADPVETFVHAGFVAQNVKTAIPQAVATQTNGYYSLDTTPILAASVNAIKELKAANDAQTAKIVGLTARIESQDRRLSDLESQLKARAAAAEGQNSAMRRLEAEFVALRSQLGEHVRTADPRRAARYERTKAEALPYRAGAVPRHALRMVTR